MHLLLSSLLSQYSSTSSQNYEAEGIAGTFMALGIIWIIVLGLVFIGVFVFQIIVLWRIFDKTGYSGAFSLFILLPGIGHLVLMIFALVLAFSKWPIERELEEMKMRLYGRVQNSQTGQGTNIYLQQQPTQTPPPPPPVNQ
ncbi:hypothetical protein JXA84_02040 [candidate division WOR-3 bacterium]|nr:hypothetical protein [candidate division WOR-3 bacterium]